MKRGVPSPDYHADIGSLRAEQEANAFAMALLMPEGLVREAVAGRPIDLCDDKAVAELARKFQVPASLMAVRLGQLFTI